MSLSPVLISTGSCFSVAWRARVPITSSASTPSTIRKGKPIALIIWWIGATWLRRSSGMLARVALYSG